MRPTPKETASHINQLVATNPDGADLKTQGDDHIRMIKSVLLTDFPNIAGAVTADHTGAELFAWRHQCNPDAA